MGRMLPIFILHLSLLLSLSAELVTSNNTTSLPHGICLEKIGNATYNNMVAHPDRLDRAFFSNRHGKVWLATVPPQGSGRALEFNESSPFIDLTDQVYFNTTLGMKGLAFHPKFTENGRLFATFTCDSVNNSGCAGKCACNSDVDCDPAMLNSTVTCRYYSVIAEFSANGTASNISMAESASPVEVRRILTVGLPFDSHVGGQILFGPTDKYLYCMMGDGGGEVDPLNLAQNKKSLLGKIMRIDIDNIPSVEEINNLDLWGNYSIPMDNPYTGNNETRPELWALGLRNPWRCSFDSERPSYFMCGDVGTDLYEEVDIIIKGGNYGWHVYEGPFLVNTTENVTNPLFPVLGYNHSEVNNNTGPGAIIGGYFYRSTTDPCLYGRYIYGDLYGGAIWAGTEYPHNSGNFTTTNIPFTCAHNSPMQCDLLPNSTLADLGLIYSFGEDNYKDNFILATSGVYRIVDPIRCNYTCS